jgi:hypothetical protein
MKNQIENYNVSTKEYCELINNERNLLEKFTGRIRKYNKIISDTFVNKKVFH